MKKYPLVTLCGAYNLSLPWAERCIASWQNIENADQTHFYVVPDGHVTESTLSTFENLGLKFKLNIDELSIFLKQYPSLAKIREEDLTWRKLIDCVIQFNNFDKIIIIDTDVLITERVYLPEGDFDIAYMREDIPAYRANWYLPWYEKMVPALNAGLIIIKPNLIDFEYLEKITAKYLINCKDYWWTEQSAWSCIAAKYKERHLFDGQDARVLSGYKKRTLREVITNKYKYFGKRALIQKEEDFLSLLHQSLIVHFAGQGKRWFESSFKYFNDKDRLAEIQIVKSKQENTLSFFDKIFISLRLYLKEL